MSARVLLVEDNAADALLIVKALSGGDDSFFATVEQSKRLDDALALVTTQAFDIVLLDLGLPDSRGPDTFSTFVHQAPGIPVVVLTGLDNSDVGLRAVHEGAQDYIVKQDMQARALVNAVRYAMERHGLRHQVEQSRDRLRLLARHLQAIREEERTQISRDIHDSLGQKLSALKMDLRWIDRRIDTTIAPPLVENLHGRIADSEGLVDDSLDIVKRIAIDLRPSVLDHLGLWAAIRDEVRRFEHRFGIAVDLQTPGESVEIDDEVATTCFRIIQELLTNVARHANAGQIEIRLAYDNGHLSLAFQDDGVGFPPNPAPSTSLGLLGIEERINDCNGEVTFDTTPGGGARIQLRIPVTVH